MAGFSHIVIQRANNLDYLEELSRGTGDNLAELSMLLPFPKSEASSAALRITLMRLTCADLEDKSVPGNFLPVIDYALKSTDIKSPRLSHFREWSALKFNATRDCTEKEVPESEMQVGGTYRWLRGLKLNSYYPDVSRIPCEQLLTMTEDSCKNISTKYYIYSDLKPNIEMLRDRGRKLLSLVAGLNESSDIFNIILGLSTLMELPIEPHKDGCPTSFFPRLVLYAAKTFFEVLQTYDRPDMETLIVFRYFLKELDNSPIYSTSEKVEIKKIKAWVEEAYNSFSFKTNLPQPA